MEAQSWRDVRGGDSRRHVPTSMRALYQIGYPVMKWKTRNESPYEVDEISGFGDIDIHTVVYCKKEKSECKIVRVEKGIRYKQESYANRKDDR
jgi:hypothetical protein